MNRNKQATRQKLIDAVGELVLQDGFQSLGVNAVARKAGVDKVLIYRYFGDFDGLISEYLHQRDYFANLESRQPQQKASSVSDIIEAGRNIFLGQLHELLNNQELQQIMLWELTQDSPATRELAAEREKDAVALFNSWEDELANTAFDIPAFSNILLGGITYLVLRSRHVQMFTGIDLNTDEGWQRIETVIQNLFDMLQHQLGENHE